MTRDDVLIMISEGGLEIAFERADKCFELSEGKKPEAYVVPEWLHRIFEQLQDGKPRWKGRRLDPWTKDEIRGQ